MVELLVKLYVGRSKNPLGGYVACRDGVGVYSGDGGGGKEKQRLILLESDEGGGCVNRRKNVA